MHLSGLVVAERGHAVGIALGAGLLPIGALAAGGGVGGQVPRQFAHVLGVLGQHIEVARVVFRHVARPGLATVHPPLCLPEVQLAVLQVHVGQGDGIHRPQLRERLLRLRRVHPLLQPGLGRLRDLRPSQRSAAIREARIIGALHRRAVREADEGFHLVKLAGLRVYLVHHPNLVVFRPVSFLDRLVNYWLVFYPMDLLGVIYDKLIIVRAFDLDRIITGLLHHGIPSVRSLFLVPVKKPLMGFPFEIFNGSVTVIHQSLVHHIGFFF